MHLIAPKGKASCLKPLILSNIMTVCSVLSSLEWISMWVRRTSNCLTDKITIMDLKTYNEKYKVATNSVPAVAVRQGR
jgi:hypothetical protein